VLLVGAGGLGSPAALYLAAAGVGRSVSSIFDLVDRSNLQRQIIHGPPRSHAEGRVRARAAARRQSARAHRNVCEKLTSGNALEILQNFDVVVDGSDNFPTRYLVMTPACSSANPRVRIGVSV